MNILCSPLFFNCLLFISGIILFFILFSISYMEIKMLFKNIKNKAFLKSNHSKATILKNELLFTKENLHNKEVNK